MHKSFIALCTVGLCTFGAVSASAATPVLNGTVGPGYTVTLTQHGKTVKTLKAGKYTFVTNDKSSAHNFAIEGPGLDQDFTSVGFVGKKPTTVTLKRGTYTYECVPHQGWMKGTFIVN